MAFEFLLLGAISLVVLILATVLAGSFTVGRESRHPWRRISLLRVQASGGSRLSGQLPPRRTHPEIGRYPDRRKE